MLNLSLSLCGGTPREYANLFAYCEQHPSLTLLPHRPCIPDTASDILLIESPLSEQEPAQVKETFSVLLLSPGDPLTKADYVLYRPLLWAQAMPRILRLLGDETVQNLFSEVWQNKQMAYLLHSISMPSHLLGFRYLTCGVLMLANQSFPAQLGMMRQIYPQIAAMEGTNPVMVDRAMRHAIDVAWRKGSPRQIADYFGYSALDKKGMPTNAEFLHVLAEKMRILMGAPSQAHFLETLAQIDRRTDCGIAIDPTAPED